MNKIKIITYLLVVAFASVPVVVINRFRRYAALIFVHKLIFCVFDSGTELFCSEVNSLSLDGALSVYTRQDK